MNGYATTGPLRSRIAIHEYGTNPVPWYAFVRSLLPPARRLADVGAGTGALWEPGTRLVACDHSAAMCAALRDRGLTAVNASADRLPFGDAAFDGAVCNHVLYHVADPRQGLAELRRIVEPGGWVAVATNGMGHMREVDDAARAAGLAIGAVHERFPAEGLDDALGDFFGNVTVHRYDDTLAVPTPEPVVAYVASVAGRALTLDEEDAVTAAVHQAIARDGAFRIGKHVVLAVAR